MLDQLADLVGLKPQRLEALITVPVQTTTLPRAPQPHAQRNPLVRKAITLVLHHPAAAAQLGQVNDLNNVKLPGIELLQRLLKVIRDNPQIKTAGLEERFRNDTEGCFLSRLAGQPPLDDEKAAPSVLRDNVARLIEHGLRDRQNALILHRNTLDDAQRAELANINAQLLTYANQGGDDAT